MYNNNFSVVALEDYWPVYQEEIIWHNENMRRKKNDHPNNIKIRLKMDTTDKMVRLCGIYHHPGNN